MTLNNDISSNVAALNARRYMDLNAAKLSRANAQLASGRVDSDPSEDPAGAALGSLFATNIAVEVQAGSNVTQASALIQLATGALTSVTEMLSTMKSRATQANSDTISNAARSMLDKEFQGLVRQIDITATSTEWNGVSLFAGGNGVATRLAGLAESGTTSPATTTDIDSAFTLNGFITGAVQNVTVTTTGANSSNITLEIGQQSFVGTLTHGEKGNLVLTSTVDPATNVTLNVTGTGLTSPGQVQKELQTLFQLDIGTPLSVRSTSTDLSSVITSVATGAATSGLTYALTYSFDDITKNVTYKLTDGAQIWTQAFPAFSADEATQGTAARTVVFDNGFSIITAGTNNEQSPAVGYEIVNVTGGTHTSMTFQIGASVTTSMSIEFQATTSALLGLSGLSVLTTKDAAAASRALDGALSQVNSMIATLGGQKSQLNFQSQALSLQIQNETAAKASFTDADIAAALQESTQYQALSTMASSVFGNILKEPEKLATLVQQTIR